MKRKLNPFVEEREALATRETAPKGIVPSERIRSLTLAKPLSLEQFVTLVTSPPGAIQDPDLNKTEIYPMSMSSESKSCNPHASRCHHSPPNANISVHGVPFAGTVVPGKSGGNPFLRAADTSLREGESVTHRFDCNTVGPVPVASGYGSRTLTHSAVHVLQSSKDNASSLLCEAISPTIDRTSPADSTNFTKDSTSVYYEPVFSTLN